MEKVKTISDTIGNTYKVCVDFSDPEQLENFPDINALGDRISALESSFNRVELSLDEIISIQNELIGE